MPNPLVLLLLVLPIDAALGGQGAGILVLIASLLCISNAIGLSNMADTTPPKTVALIGFLLAQRMRNPALAALEIAGVVLAAFLAPPFAAASLVMAALLSHEARRRLAHPR